MWIVGHRITPAPIAATMLLAGVFVVAALTGTSTAQALDEPSPPTGRDALDAHSPLAMESNCGESWIPTFGSVPGVPTVTGSRVVFDMTMFDDGSGSALYAGGQFGMWSVDPKAFIAKWDGSSWSALGTGVNSSVRALATFDDGSGPALYAAGDFTVAGGVSANHIARWDGTSWAPLGDGLNKWVECLAVFDDGSGGGPALYAGGGFTKAGGVSASGIARWDGASWSSLDDGVNGTVQTLAAREGQRAADRVLYAGGTFSVAGSVAASNIARWDGSSWAPLGVGVTGGSVHALLVIDGGPDAAPMLYVGGGFEIAGGEVANHVATWSDGSWTPVGEGTDSSVQALGAFDDGMADGPTIYAGGSFASAGGEPASRIARWNGRAWAPVAEGASGWVLCFLPTTELDTTGPVLYVGGFFESAGEVTSRGIARWDGAKWSAVGLGLDDWVMALTDYDDGRGDGHALYAAGLFTTAGGQRIDHVARWKDGAWSPLGSGVNGPVFSLVAYNGGTGDGDVLVVGGAFTEAGGVPANCIAQWNGSTWSPLGDGVGNTVWALAVLGDDFQAGPGLYAGGLFTTAGGLPAKHVARWDGAGWSALGGGVNGEVRAMIAYDDGSGQGPALHVGGYFNVAGGAPAKNIARWDGSEWSPLGVGANSTVWSLALLDDDATGIPILVAGGTFTYAGGRFVHGVAGWNGQSWSPFGDGLSSFDIVSALTTVQLGTKQELVAGGWGLHPAAALGAPVARWDGLEWLALEGGPSNDVWALTTFDDGAGSGPALFAGGQFLNSGSGDSYLAKWTLCLPDDPADPADLNGDGTVDGVDLGLLLANWGGPGNADLNGDGTVDGADLGVLLAHWSG